LEKVFAVMLSTQRSSLPPLVKGEIKLKVPLLKGDLGESSLLLLAKRLLKHPLRASMVLLLAGVKSDD
jgi:hypothetical protein